jgi:ABC-type nitrate/sulfonate/bicarbonate transport system substrate-binding protein
LAAFSCASKPEPAQARKVVINYPNKSGSQWPLFIAKEQGFYAKYGLDVDLQFGVYPAGVVMLASGEGQMVNSSLEQVLQAASKDDSMKLVGSSLNRGTFALIASKNIKSVEALKGKTIAVSTLGDGPYGYVVAILAKAGLTERDVQWISAGSGVTSRAAALTGGQADATILTAPVYFKLEAEGYNVLVNLAEREDIFASTAYLMAARDLKDLTLAQSLIKAHAEAIKKFYEDKPAAVAAYLKYDLQAVPAEVERTYDLYAKPQAFERVPYVLKPAVAAAVEQLHGASPAGAIDNRAVDQLVKDGFFVQLFGEAIRAEQERKAALAFKE